MDTTGHPITYLYLDIETTGLYPPDDEILEIAIADDSDQPLLNTLVRPTHNESWPEAQAIHGISPDDITTAPTLDELRPQIINLLFGQNVVIYNADFESGFLGAELAKAASISCCIEAFAEDYGDWSDYWGNYRWQSLAVAAQRVYHQWSGDSHRALTDALACRAVWQYLTEDAEKARVAAIRADREASAIAKAELREMEWRTQRNQRRYQERMSDFWMRWLKYSEWTGGSCRQSEWERLNLYTKVFTGFPYDAWQNISKNPDMPSYRLQKNIPDDLKPFSFFKDYMPWIREELNPDAYYLSKSGKVFRLLYAVEQPKEIMDRYPPRYYSKSSRPADIMPRTDLLKRGISKPHIEAMQPVAEQYNWYQRGWIPLYQMPKT
ncbi:DNA polymerase III PolC-type [Acaryochloris thomasi RCC1774]|uniref:DNA polymerase III PolC-type n=1 Tax=Acaryochloris thomasi RCC1774 TaxID=1764569 RepID=A0A2W1JNR5_9CYAN|nr:3'-5' exonuclease [Acaryochloris thomasi]PZD70547.1 DNA polymerase III PolC-type [Acaryochloris thomasi RCC1774]